MKRQVFICLFLLAFAPLGMAQVVISEIASSNENGVADVFGKTSDWLELYNAGDDAVDLESYHLSDHPGYLSMWSFPEVIIPAKGYLLIFCSGEISTDPNELHANFKLSQSGEHVFLSNPDGHLISWVEFGYIPTDQSYATHGGQTSEFLICSDPTPGRDNELSRGLFYSHPSGYYDQEFQLELYSAGSESSVFYTQNGNDPDVNQRLYSTTIEITDVSDRPYNISGIPTTPLEGSPLFVQWMWKEPQSVYMANVFRAGVFRGDTLASKVVSLSYFVDPEMKTRYKYPVVSIITDSLNLFDDDIGIYVPGSIYGSVPIDYWPTGNFTQSGSEWEREMYISFFEPDGKQVFETSAGMRIRGFGSAGFSQKSLNIYFREEYGLNKIKAPLFSDSPVNDYKRLVFRNGGNDFPDAHFKDSYLSRVISSLNVEVQAYEPIVVFINGEYWGMHNMREKHDKHHFGYKYGLEKDEINVVGVCGELKDGGNADYFDLIDYIETHDLADGEVYAQVSERLDIESTIDYNIAEIYFANYDWPSNNYKMWKTNEDGDKWKYIIHDLDFTLGYNEYALYSTNSMEHAVTVTDDWPTHPCSNTILRNLLRNDAFVNQFLDRFKYCLENVFDRNRMNQILDEFVQEYSYGISEHISRFRFPASEIEWFDRIEVFREFIDQRPCYMRRHIIDFFEDHSFDYNCRGKAGAPDLNFESDLYGGQTVLDDIEIKVDGAALIIPNPNSGDFYIRNISGNALAIRSIEIFDALGRRVYTDEKEGINVGVEDIYEIKAGGLTNGIYILRITDESRDLSYKVMIDSNINH